MIKIIASNIGRKNVYTRIDTDDVTGKETHRREYSLRVATTRLNGYTQFSLIDDNGETNLYVHQFLNQKMYNDGRSDNSRRMAAYALCKFHAFLTLMDYTEYYLNGQAIQQLIMFMRGEGKTQCSNRTINLYLSVIREYLRLRDIRPKALFDVRYITKTDVKDDKFEINTTTKVYRSSLRTNPHQKEQVPKYISPAEYQSLIEIARSHKDWTAIILMHLMYRYGMRLGECLGLTEEDIVNTPYKEKDVLTLILRNRLTDEPFQMAKLKINPHQASDYQTKTYIDSWRNDSYSHIYLSEQPGFNDAFLRYVAESAAKANEEHPDNYRSCIADIVCPEDFEAKHLKENHYIFLNRLGKRLSAQLWGKILKEYFVEAGITVDINKKTTNLSHRFRHGFAMLHAHYINPPVSAVRLKDMMRHRSISSTMIYFNPTNEDKFIMKVKLEKQIQDTYNLNDND